MQPTMRFTLLLFSLISAFYLVTGVVYEEGGFEYRLVVKPRPSFITVFGGGEEGTWKRNHPQDPSPWWQTGTYRTIATGSWEGGTSPWWSWSYGLGRIFIWIGWPILATILLFRKFKSRKSVSAAMRA
jgi:hypothetical protein